MVSGKHKSNSFAAIHVRTVSGTKVRFRKRKPSPARCSETNKVLHGVPRGRPVDIAKMNKSQRRPERPYGGVLSSEDMRKKMKQKARNLE